VKGEDKRDLHRSDEQAEPCGSASVSNGLVLCIDIILAASYSLSSSLCLTHSHSRQVLLAIVLAACTLIDIVLVTVYSSTSQCLCHSESCANMSQSSPSYSPRPTLYRPCHILLALIVATSYSLSRVLTASTLIDIVLVKVYSTTFWCLCHSESYANHVTKLTIILAASYSLSSISKKMKS